MTKQEFRKIASLKNQYEISADGEILRNVHTRKRRKFYKNDSGYYCVNVTIGDFKKTLYVAALVAECWLGIKPTGFQIDHIDRNRNNNHFKNLRYVRPATNVRNSTGRAQIPITLADNNNSWQFCSMAQAARFISRKKQKSIRCCKRKFSGRKSIIFGYDVTYHGEQIPPRPKPKSIQIPLFEELIF